MYFICGEPVLDNIKRFYNDSRYYDKLFLSIAAAFSVSMVSRTVELQTGLDKAFGYPFYFISVFVFLAAFLAVLAATSLFDQRILIGNDKKILLMLGIVLSFIVVYVIL